MFRGRAARDADLAWTKIHPGTWTHVLISLRAGSQTVYINGRKQKLWQAGYVTQGNAQAQEPLKKWRERTDGKDIDDTWTWTFAPSPTLIEIRSRGEDGGILEEKEFDYRREKPQWFGNTLGEERNRAHGLKNYMPHIWLGDDDRGLYFGAENDRGWTVNAETPAQEIVRENGAVVFRMNVICEPVIVTVAGHRFHFILLPTPAKPEPPDWRKQMLAGGVTFGSVDTFGGFDMKTDPADPSSGDSFLLEPRSWDHAARQAPLCRLLRRRGLSRSRDSATRLPHAGHIFWL